MSQVFFAGDSAGAQIASNYVAIQTNSELANQMEIGQAVASDSIKGALLYCGPYDIDKFNNSSHSIIMKFLLNQIAWSYIGKRTWQDTEPGKKAWEETLSFLKKYSVNVTESD